MSRMPLTGIVAPSAVWLKRKTGKSDVRLIAAGKGRRMNKSAIDIHNILEAMGS